MAGITFDDLVFSVSDPTKHDDHIIYKVSIRDESRSVVLHSVWRRFTEFEEVFKQLKARNTQPPLPDIPKKKTFGNFDAKYVEKRRGRLENYLSCIKENKFLVRCPEFRALIGYDELERKLKEQTRVKKANEEQDVIRVDVNDHPGYNVVVDEEEDLTILQRYLRTAGYRLEKPLPRLAVDVSKSRFLVRADGYDDSLLMCVSRRRVGGMEITTDKQKKRFVNFMQAINAQACPFLDGVVSADFDMNTQRAFVTKRAAKHGSMRDYMYGKADWNEAAALKYKKKPSPLKEADVAYFGKQLILAVQCLEENGIPCPHLSLGNIVVGAKQTIQITDWEDAMLGLTRLPFLHLPGDLPDRTSPYLLMAGVCLFEMAAGETSNRLRRMMICCQGDLFSSEVSTEPEEEESETRVEFPLDFTKMKLPEKLTQVLQKIFDPEEHITCDEVLDLPLFKTMKLKEPIRGADAEVPKVKVKSKEIDALREACEHWRERLDRELEGEEVEEETSPREKRKKDKKDKKSKLMTQGGAAGAPPPPPAGGPPGAPPPPGVPGAPPPPPGGPRAARRARRTAAAAAAPAAARSLERAPPPPPPRPGARPLCLGAGRRPSPWGGVRRRRRRRDLGAHPLSLEVGRRRSPWVAVRRRRRRLRRGVPGPRRPRLRAARRRRQAAARHRRRLLLLSQARRRRRTAGLQCWNRFEPGPSLPRVDRGSAARFPSRAVDFGGHLFPFTVSCAQANAGA
ncbi:Slowpoke-binding protein [Diplonema papillatum]|nr:Slowpoke-binding protein [Diplonema papillatum]